MNHKGLDLILVTIQHTTGLNQDESTSLIITSSKWSKSRSDHRPVSASHKSHGGSHRFNNKSGTNDSQFRRDKQDNSVSSSSYRDKGARPKDYSGAKGYHKSTVVRSSGDHTSSQDVDYLLAKAMTSASADDEYIPPSQQMDETKKPLGNLNIIFSENDDCGDPYVSNDNFSYDETQKNKCEICSHAARDVNLDRMPCGHVTCAECSQMSSCILCTSKEEQNLESENDLSKPQCVICMDDVENGNKLKCGHEFHHDCIKSAFSHKPVCPVCGTVYGNLLGNQPDNGEMNHYVESRSLPGYEGHRTIVIEYNFPDGRQGVMS